MSKEKKRDEECHKAVCDEVARINKAIEDGKEVIIPVRANNLASGEHVSRVNQQMEVFTKEGNWWCYCNDYRWEELLQAAGVERHSLFKK